MSGSGQAASSASRPAGSVMSAATAMTLAAGCGDLCDGLLELLAVAAVDDDVDAFGRQRLGARSAEPLARRADDGRAPPDPQVHAATLDTLPVARQYYVSQYECHSMSEPMTDERLRFETEPSRYRHWKLEIDDADRDAGDGGRSERRAA